jgi:hypothetical protein
MLEMCYRGGRPGVGRKLDDHCIVPSSAAAERSMRRIHSRFPIAVAVALLWQPMRTVSNFVSPKADGWKCQRSLAQMF